MRFVPGCRCCGEVIPEDLCDWCINICCIEFTITGVVNGTGHGAPTFLPACVDCDDINDTYRLCRRFLCNFSGQPVDETCFNTSDGFCCSSFPNAVEICNQEDRTPFQPNMAWWIRRCFNEPTTYRLYFSFGDLFTHIWMAEFSTLQAICDGFTNLELTLVYGDSNNKDCDFSAATVTATAFTGNDCCPDCNADVPRQYQLEISNFVDDTCSDCEVFNGTFILTLETPCIWRTPPFTICGATYFYELTISTFSIAVNLRKFSDGSYVVIWVEGTPDLDCETFVDYEVPLDVASFGVAPAGCTNNDTGIALVTAL